MATLSELMTPRPVGTGYQLDVPEGWRQGRGAFGGLVVGALIRAIELRMADPARKVRSVTAEIPGPVEHGTVDIAVEVLRHGKNVSTARAALSQHGEIRSHAVAILGADRGAAAADGLASPASPASPAWPAWNDLSRPEAPSWTQLAPIGFGDRPGPWPEFARNFEFRLVEGAPASGGAARTVGWIRSRDPGPARDASYIAAMIDAWWPAAVVRLTRMRPMATIAFTLEIAGGVDGLDPEAPLLYRGRAPVSGDGYCFETRELWSEDGRLVALNHQTFAIIQ
ncbi:MAG TPA: thioesterase family protein [Kofleriaceae bacterium]|nr:thioesterase family protein [Kofleriaceae bacterium]